MCGIFGYIGYRNAVEILIKGLKRLEYRGYDSCGFAVKNENKIEVRKNVGKIDDVIKKEKVCELQGFLGIAHTRWATHGNVTKENAHPHTDCKNEIAIVHNGIIENYEELKSKLKNHFFRSKTDSEVIAHLIEEYLKKYDFIHACAKAFLDLKGSFAVLVIYSKLNKIVCIRKDSPLVIGIGLNENFVASDIPALLPFTNKIIYLRNYDFCILGDKDFRIVNLIDKSENKNVETITIDYKEDQNTYKHYMIKEILESVKVISKIDFQDKISLEEFLKELKNRNKIFLVACGSSYHACLYAKYLFSNLKKLFIPIIASEFENFLNLIDNDLVIAVSQSGETADVLNAVKLAKKAKIFSIVNNPLSSLARMSEVKLNLNAGIEYGVAATKTYIAQLALFYYLYCLLSGKKFNKEELKNYLYDLTARSRRIFISKVAEKLKNEKNVFLIGRGINYVTALEGALKLKEITYIHAEALAGGELKHGTLALIEKNVPIIAFIDNYTKEKIISNIQEMKARGAFIISISPFDHESFDIWIKVPEANLANPIVQIIPIQLLTYEIAIKKKLDPDKPRNLAKSVTVL